MISVYRVRSVSQRVSAASHAIRVSTSAQAGARSNAGTTDANRRIARLGASHTRMHARDRRLHARPIRRADQPMPHAGPHVLNRSIPTFIQRAFAIHPRPPRAALWRYCGSGRRSASAAPLPSASCAPRELTERDEGSDNKAQQSTASPSGPSRSYCSARSRILGRPRRYAPTSKVTLGSARARSAGDIQLQEELDTDIQAKRAH